MDALPYPEATESWPIAISQVIPAIKPWLAEIGPYSIIIEEVICDENDNLEKCRELNIEYVPHIKYQLYNIKTKSYGKLLDYKENKDLENLINFFMKKFI